MRCGATGSSPTTEVESRREINYEEDYEKIEFEAGDAGVLGQGNYGCVLKAKVPKFSGHMFVFKFREFF